MVKRRRIWRPLSPWKKGLSIEELDELVRIMDENRLTEVTVQEGGRKLALKRSSWNPAEAAVGTKGAEPEAGDTDGLSVITSPTVGIFYGSPAPGEPPFVIEGQIIKQEQVVALIETLKVMSEVRSGICGRVISIEVGDGELVEFGQPLMSCEEMD